MIGKHFTETSNKVELRFNCVLINRARPVLTLVLISVNAKVLKKNIGKDVS